MPKLFSEFSPTNSEAWKHQIVKDLKAIDFEALLWQTNSGIDIKPFYTKEDVALTTEPFNLNPDWSICEYIKVDDSKLANAKAKNALQNGASGLVFKIHQKTNFEVLCKDILFEHIYSLFEVLPQFETELRSFLDSKKISAFCFVECDNILSGKIKINDDVTSLALNTSIYNEAGASILNQLAFSLAHVNEYLNEFAAQNKILNIKHIHLTVAISGDFFMEIAKLRALRKLLTFILQQYQSHAEVHIHAQTTLVNKTNIDIYNNLLRSTTEIMSASIGGANSIVVFPFDLESNDNNDFSSRMARNQQLILKEESYLNKVSDIAAGSYYIETITKTLCEKAWDKFKMIENKGGFINALNQNEIQSIIKNDADQLLTNFKEGKLILVGVNKFQNKQAENSIKKKEINHQNSIIPALRFLV
ncbi:MAG: methylmalonyl-CoA mutase family protein [Bacteroidota bacterium]